MTSTNARTEATINTLIGTALEDGYWYAGNFQLMDENDQPRYRHRYPPGPRALIHR